MKKTIGKFGQAAAVAAAIAAGPASAAVFNVPAGDAKPTTARGLKLEPSGVGHVLLIPYFTVQNGHATLISVTNTDAADIPAQGGLRAKAVKVRFRSAGNADNLMDFQVFLAPGDTWTAQLTQSADGAVLTTADKSCTLPANVNRSLSVSRLPGSAAEKVAGTLEGYVEVITMADIPSLPIASPATGAYGSSATLNPLYAAVKSSGGAAPCTAASLAPLDTEASSLQDLRGKGMDAPTAGLMGSWIIINVPTGAAYSGRADAILAVTDTGEAGVGNAVFFPQTNEKVANAVANTLTADPVFRNNTSFENANVFSSLDPGATGFRVVYFQNPLLTLPIVPPSMQDFPDLSTPYLEAGADLPVTSVAQASLLSNALAVTELKNEFLTESLVSAGTDWVISLPTRRYGVAMDYRPDLPVRVFTDQTPLVGVNASAQDHFVSGNTYVSPLDKNRVCMSLPNANLYSRGGVKYPVDGFVTMGSGAPPLPLCGAVNVVTFGQPAKGILGASISVSDAGKPTFSSGWGLISTRPSGFGTNGLPLRGAAFIRASSPGAQFGATFEHNVTR